VVRSLAPRIERYVDRTSRFRDPYLTPPMRRVYTIRYMLQNRGATVYKIYDITVVIVSGSTDHEEHLDTPKEKKQWSILKNCGQTDRQTERQNNKPTDTTRRLTLVAKAGEPIWEQTAGWMSRVYTEYNKLTAKTESRRVVVWRLQYRVQPPHVHFHAIQSSIWLRHIVNLNRRLQGIIPASRDGRSTVQLKPVVDVVVDRKPASPWRHQTDVETSVCAAQSPKSRQVPRESNAVIDVMVH